MLRSFYLYKLNCGRKPLPDLLEKFSIDKIKNNIAEIQMSEDEEKKKFLLVIEKREGNYLYGYFFKLKRDFKINILDESEGTIATATLAQDKSCLEKSHFIYDTSKNVLLGEYNSAGIRFFQNPLRDYLKQILKRENLELEIIYNQESYENISKKEIKSICIKIAKPKLKLFEYIFALGNIDVLNEANDDDFFIELKIKAGYRRNLNKKFSAKIIEKLIGLTSSSGIKKFEVKEAQSDAPLELIKDKILKRKIEINGLSPKAIFSKIIEAYEDLNIDEILDEDE